MLHKLGRILALYLILNTLYLILPPQAQAHAFGQQYNLPVPFQLYAYGAALAIIASFAVIGVFVTAKKSSGYKKINITRWGIVRFFKVKTVTTVIQTMSLFLFLFTIFTGFFGVNDSISNFNMTFFWVITVLGITYATFFLGNIYATLNPFRILINLIEKITGPSKASFEYPKWLGYYPALIFYFLFIFTELFGRVNPFELSLILVNYTVITFIGYYFFGRENWLSKAEFFGVFFKLFSKISLIEKEDNKVYLRPPFIGLTKANLDHPSLIPFVVFMLSSTAFDGFKETTAWWNIFFSIPASISAKIGDNAQQFIGTLGMIGVFLVFFLLYLILTTMVKLLSQSKEPVGKLLLYFAPSLIPIAFVYNLAHYYTLLFIQGQLIIPLSSDPLGKGWNLFNTGGYLPNIAIIDTNTIWHSQVAFILIGHIAAVYIAHILAINSFSSSKKALVSQLPTLILMIFYTIAGLWILSQPLTSGL